MKKKNNLLLLLTAGGIFLVFVILVFITLFGDSIFSKKHIKDIPSELDGTGFSEDTDPAKIEQNNQSSDVMLLLNKVPYNGKNFSLFYSYSGDFFTLYVNPSNPVAGNAEFDLFLKQNSIDSRSWIYDLRTVNVKPTPEP